MKKIVPIKYTSRDFQSIRNDLVEHAKRYYPDSFKDFNNGSFGSLMIDTVSYVGDILSFYLDYQANESFLETASEFDNVLKIAKQLGYKFNNGRTSTGIVSFYISVPANTTNLGPNLDYAPVLRRGSTFSTNSGVDFILTEDVNFQLPANEVRPLLIGTNGAPLTYGIKAYGVVVSGVTKTEIIEIGEYQKFRRIKLEEPSVVEILTIFDEEGNEYFEVDSLSQNVVYRSYTNRDPETYKLAEQILKPYIVPRRFVVDSEIDATYIQFGASSDVVKQDSRMLAEPSKTVINMSGKDYIQSDSFDPSIILSSDKFGISPSNTRLFVTYRYSPLTTNLNFSVNSLVNVGSVDFMFTEQSKLNTEILSTVQSSLELTNEAPIIGEVTQFNSDEIKARIRDTFSAQRRAVTQDDYKALVYNMPAKFGSIKRVGIFRDEKSTKRNINIYVLCENSAGYLTAPNKIVKNNIKTWVAKSKMINDSIDILDGKIINYGIEFTAIGSQDRSKYDIIADAIDQLKKDFARLPEFGETFILSDVFTSLKKVNGILDVVDVRIVTKNGGKYSSSIMNIDKQFSPDKRYIIVPKNVIMELKYPNSDIKGTIL